MGISAKQALFILWLIPVICTAQHKDEKMVFNWSQTRPIPDPEGFAGSYAGVSNGALIVAGGANFPGNTRPWSKGIKTWYDKIFVLEQPGGKWMEKGKLLRPMGYGVALTYKGAVLCLGGGDAKDNYPDAFILKYKNGKIETTRLPALPWGIINACGVITGDLVYIAGGIKTPSGLAENNFWSLDLSKPAQGKKWIQLEPVPGPARMQAVAGVANGKVYVFGGVHLIRSGTGLNRQYLRDCWEYTPGKSWKRIADLPHTLGAGPTPAYNTGRSQLLLFGGDDGTNAARVAELKDTHPGFRNEILAYNTLSNSWSVTGHIPVEHKKDTVLNPHASLFAPVTTPLVIWNDNIVIPGGESRPAVRSNRVLIAAPAHQRRKKK